MNCTLSDAPHNQLHKSQLNACIPQMHNLKIILVDHAERAQHYNSAESAREHASYTLNKLNFTTMRKASVSKIATQAQTAHQCGEEA